MTIEQIEKNLAGLIKNFQKEDFIFELLLSYGIPKATITLLKKGRHNLSKQERTIILKNKLFFHEIINADLHATIDALQKEPATMRHKPRFIIVTDHETLLAIDTKTNEHLDIPIKDIIKHSAFFLPWAGIEKHKHDNENPADRKAAEKMAKLYDEILSENNINNDDERAHDLNVFLSRLLFCFFAEDTEIFASGLFTDSVASHTQADGSDLDAYLDKLFDILNSKDRQNCATHYQKFPYVNGDVFAEKQWIPKFTTKSRKIIIECGELDWSQINPDIFGSMMQAVAHPGQRESLGMHYTSVPNIMKVIEPLFLNELREEFEKSVGNKNKLQALLNRISHIKFFDPACGSGNFLIITYKEIRRLEMQILKALNSTAYFPSRLNNFYGIEIDDFAYEIAKLSLYLAEHQMNIEYKNVFGKINPTLPLKTGGNIVCANATRVEWSVVCPREKNDEIYVFGNPPYLGSRNQNKNQKEDLKTVFNTNYKSLDYISCWFALGARYIENVNIKLSFVSTNSITQGEQVVLLWPQIFKRGIEIFYAHQSFKWANSAKKNAGVTVVIIGLRNYAKGKKIIYKDKHAIHVPNINPYLTPSNTYFIKRRSSPLSKYLPKIVYGNLLNDGGNLVLNKQEKEKLLAQNPTVKKYIKKYLGAKEFLRGEERWCLFIGDEVLLDAIKIPEIKNRLEKVSRLRAASTEVSTRKIAKNPNRYYFTSHKNTNSLIVPRTSSERREYIPIGFLDSSTIISDAAQAIYDAEPWIFGLISSKIHMTWVRAVAGRLKTDYRYSSALCYNTFPFPDITSKQKEEINRHVFNVLEERERYPEKTIAELYNPDDMPEGLREAHHNLDLAIERCYRLKPFTSDEERLEYLFKLYEKMINEEKLNK